MIRQLLNQRCGSTFWETYRYTMPHDRTLTDVDGYGESSLFGPRLYEKRSRGYRPVPDRALKTLERFASLLDLSLDVVERLPPSAIDTQHTIYVAERSAHYHVFCIRGNRSDMQGPDACKIDLSAWNAISSRAIKCGIDARLIAVDRFGSPSVADSLWLNIGPV